MDLTIPTSLQYFSFSRFKKKLSPWNGNIKTHNNRRTRISRWLGQENEENVARTRNFCGWPSSPRLTVVRSSWFHVGNVRIRPSLWNSVQFLRISLISKLIILFCPKSIHTITEITEFFRFFFTQNNGVLRNLEQLWKCMDRKKSLFKLQIRQTKILKDGES